MATVLERSTEITQLDPRSLRAVRRQIKRDEAAEELRKTRENAEQIRLECQSLIGFIRAAWKVLEPTTPFVEGWHIEAICRHLEACVDGRINRLLINVPPGCSKSLIVSVFFQAWLWGPKGQRSKRFLTTSFNDKAVKRDTRKCRNLMLSQWYKTLWPEVEFVRTGETSFENTDTGNREGVAINSLTGQRGDFFIVDDPHSVKKAESETERNNTTRDFIEGGQNRLNDQAKSVIIVIMQRLHMDDLSGVLLARQLGYVHLMIPMKFELERKCETIIGWSDPREAEGELMDPVRFPPEEIARLTKDNEYMEAGQYQQRPAPREGGFFKVDKITVIPHDPGGGKIVRGWDLAGTKRKTSAYTVGLQLRRVDGRFIITDVRRDRWRPNEVRQQVKQACIDDGPNCKQSLPQDPGQAGVDQKSSYADYLAGYVFRFSVETGEKTTRAEPVSAAVDAGIVDMVQAPWNSALKEEMRNFPAATFKDQVDALSRAFAELVNRPGDDAGGAPILGDEIINGSGDDEQEFNPWGTPTDTFALGLDY